MVDLKFKKKVFYYILSVLAMFILALLGPLRYVGNGDKIISVLNGIVRLSKETLQESTTATAFRACTSQWMYTLMPVLASIPSTSYIYDELKSRFYMGVMLRKGRYRYVYSNFFYAAVSGAATVSAGLIVYAVLVYCLFPINPTGIEIIGYTEITIWESVLNVLKIILCMALYGMSMSVFASFLVYLLPNLYVDLSILFIAVYMLREIVMRENIIIPVVIVIGTAILYLTMCRTRGESI